jgi:predicted transcriptional regulator
MHPVAMTVRPSDEQAKRLSEQAAREHRSQQAVVLDAIDEYIQRRHHEARVANSSRFGAQRYEKALDELGSI